MGIINTTRSVNKLIVPETMYDTISCPHVPPGIFGFQLNAIGRQTRKVAKMVPIAQAATRAMVPQTMRTTALEGKMRRYSSKMDILVQLRLKTQKICTGKINLYSLVIGPLPCFSTIAASWS